jgi:hypothetical protein
VRAALIAYRPEAEPAQVRALDSREQMQAGPEFVASVSVRFGVGADKGLPATCRAAPDLPGPIRPDVASGTLEVGSVGPLSEASRRSD